MYTALFVLDQLNLTLYTDLHIKVIWRSLQKYIFVKPMKIICFVQVKAKYFMNTTEITIMVMLSNALD